MEVHRSRIRLKARGCQKADGRRRVLTTFRRYLGLQAALTELGVRVDEFLQSACSDILGLFILSVNTELALGPMSQVRY